jgi:hypothetical protein
MRVKYKIIKQFDRVCHAPYEEFIVQRTRYLFGFIPVYFDYLRKNFSSTPYYFASFAGSFLSEEEALQALNLYLNKKKLSNIRRKSHGVVKVIDQKTYED